MEILKIGGIPDFAKNVFKARYGRCDINILKAIKTTLDNGIVRYEFICVFKDTFPGEKYWKFKDYRERRFVDCFQYATILNDIARWSNELEEVDITKIIDKKIELEETNEYELCRFVVKGIYIQKRFINQFGKTFTSKPNFLLPKSRFSKDICRLIIRLYNQDAFKSVREINEFIKHIYNVDIPLKDIYRILRKRNGLLINNHWEIDFVD